MRPLRSMALCLLFLGPAAALAVHAESPAVSGGYVDGEAFRALIDDTKDVVEINLEGAILQALAKSGGPDKDAGGEKDLFAKLKSIHAVIGTVKGPAADALSLVQKTDQKLVAKGWQRITRITDSTSSVSVLTHTVGEHVDGLVALIFDTDDKELVFANLAGEIDVNRLGDIGARLNVPGLNLVPGAH